MIQVPAIVSDLAQRAITLNKHEQRQYLLEAVGRLHLRPGARVLDFGCGTGLFAGTLSGAGLDYYGFDPDAAAVHYAARIHPSLTFVSRLEDAAALSPFDAVIANCCFHHIDDEELGRQTLPAIAGLMREDARFLLIDVLPLERDASTIRRLFNVLEQGTHKRTGAQLEALLVGRFAIDARRVLRFFAFSASVPINPVFNDVIQFELSLA
jgi:2-polyprenyl-3-methyl-5-hydroxy-6-metoxy-1,4-benzoquinol methylase